MTVHSSMHLGEVYITAARAYVQRGDQQRAQKIIDNLLQHANDHDAQKYIRDLIFAGEEAYKKEDFNESLLFSEKALVWAEKIYGAEDVKLGIVLMAVADSNLSLARYVEAEVYYQRALRIYEEHFGKEHLSVSLALRNLKELYAITGDESAAKSLSESYGCAHEGVNDFARMIA